MIHFIVYGTPVPKARPRLGLGGHAFTPARTRSYEKFVGAVARKAMLEHERIEKPKAVKVDILAIFPIPHSWPLKRRTSALHGDVRHVVRPDADNATKSALDALNGIVYEDDSQVDEIRVRKAYGEEPRLEVWVEEH